MKPCYMLDTNICLYLMKNQPVEVGRRFSECFAGEVVISSITLAELEYGLLCSPDSIEQNRNALKALMEDLVVVPFDELSAKAYGPVRLSTKGRIRDALDKLIASHALALGVVLVTNNEEDFLGIPGLLVENWVKGPDH